MKIVTLPKLMSLTPQQKLVWSLENVLVNLILLKKQNPQRKQSMQQVALSCKQPFLKVFKKDDFHL